VPAEELEYTDELTSQLTLVQDGLGREDADVIGLAKALYRVVYELGGQQAQIEKFGLSRNEVAGYLAVAQLPDDVANLVAEGDFSITGCRLVYELASENQRDALLRYIANAGGLTVSNTQHMVSNLKNFSVPTAGMMDSPRVRNTAMLKSAVYKWYMDNDPVPFWIAVANGRNVTMPTAVAELVPELACENCALKDALGELPKINISGGYNCQKTDKATWCLFNSDGQIYADFQVRAYADVHYDGTGITEHYFSSVEKAKEAYANLVTSDDEDTEEAEDTRPIDAQRTVIAAFIKQHPDMNGADHPWATSCAACGYKTAGSPVKSDPTAPPCAFAGKRFSIRMGKLKEDKVNIPFCHQYMPTKNFADMIPETDPGNAPREINDNILDQLLGNIEQSGVPALKFLTGVPFKASERYMDWLRNRINETVLTDGQVATLIAWLSAEINLARGKAAPIQLKAGRVGQFVFAEV
jgi:ParB-like chromosome segregation protein Spo0J